MERVKLAIAVLLGLPPLLAWHAYTYTLFGHRLKLDLKKKTLYLEPRSGEADYTVTVSSSHAGWRIVVRTRPEIDPFD